VRGGAMKERIVVKTYKEPKAYQRDMKKMAKKGYRVVSTSSGPNRRRASALLLKGVLFAKRRAETTVTYELMD